MKLEFHLHINIYDNLANTITHNTEDCSGTTLQKLLMQLDYKPWLAHKAQRN